MINQLVVSNGQVFAGWKHDYTLGNLTFPHVGLHEHTSDPWRFGVWAAGQFAWSPEFQRRLSYIDDTLVTDVTMSSERLGVELRCNDVVHYRRPILLKKVSVTNKRQIGMEVRLFFHHDPYIKESADSNTVYFCPSSRSLVAYKEDIYILANAKVGDKVGFTSYACGHKKSRGMEGTWRDAEDGILGNSINAEGAVDSVGSVSLYLAPGETKVVWYWMTFGKKFSVVDSLNKLVVTKGPDKLLDSNLSYWHYYVTKQLSACTDEERCFSFSPASPRHEPSEGEFADLGAKAGAVYRRSVLTIRAHSDAAGGVIAACDSNIRSFNNGTYGSVWPRDAAEVVAAADIAGHGEVPRKFFSWAARTITDEGYFLHKYTPSGMLAASWHPWLDADGNQQLPIQEDETALPLIALWKHYTINKCTEFIYEGETELFTSFVEPAGRFLMSYRDEKTGLPKPSYDLWEERHGVSAFTIATVYGALRAAARLSRPVDMELCKEFDRAADEVKAAFKKYFYNEALGRYVRLVRVKCDGSVEQDLVIDSCMSAIWYFGLVAADEPEMVRTMQAIESRLWVAGPIGGLCRYEGDVYQGRENPWIITTLWLAQWHIAKAKKLEELARPRQLIDWAVARASDALLLPEQVDPQTGFGLSVNPLTWSHATFVMTVVEYRTRYEELSGTSRNQAKS